MKHNATHPVSTHPTNPTQYNSHTELAHKTILAQVDINIENMLSEFEAVDAQKTCCITQHTMELAVLMYKI